MSKNEIITAQRFMKELRRYQKGSVTRRHFLGVTGLGLATAVLGSAIPGLKPRMAYLCSTIAELIGTAPDDPRAVRCALSVTSQFNSLLWTKGVAELLNVPQAVPGPVSEIADHIARFSLGGISTAKSGVSRTRR